nr:catalase-related domain-containing protein [uncultured Gilliamella sp.]
MDEDYYSQPRALFNLMNAEQKQLLIDNIIGSMKNVDHDIQIRQLKHFYNVHPDYGQGIAQGFGIDIELIKS